MLFILYVIGSALLVWNTDAQGSQIPFGFGQFSSGFDFDRLFGNYNGYSHDGAGNGQSNEFSRAHTSNAHGSNLKNGIVNKAVSNNKLNVRASHQSAFQDNSAPQLSQKSKTQQQSIQTSSQYSQNSYQQTQQSQLNSFHQKTQTQQQSYQQSEQQQDQSYQQSAPLQQEYNQNVQAQQQLQKQNSQAQQQLYQQNVQSQQQSYQQNGRPQQQINQLNEQPQQQSYQQNGQPQQQSYQQNGQPQQQLYQQNGQPQQQSYQHNGQPQQQSYQQNGQPQQQSYQQNGQPQQQSYQHNQNSQNPTANILTSKYGEDDTKTGKPKQNANYNNATFAITRFGLKMFKAMNRDYENIVASPYSVAALLALVQQGAHGDTQLEITQLLQLTPESSANLFKSLITSFKKRNSHNIFKVGSNVFLAREFQIDSKFKSTALNTFGSDVRVQDFMNPYSAAEQINAWVAGQTNQRIKDLLVPEAIQQDTLAMLVNAVYFKGTWNKKFDPDMTTRKKFTRSDGSKTELLFMRARRYYQVDTDPVIKSQVLLMPFEGTQYTMMFILPFEGVYASEVLASLTEPQLYAYHRITPKEAKVEIPKFSIKKDSDMAYVLNLLGLWKIFSPEVDLTGMVSRGNGSPRINSGLHSATLSIDENGSTAAAATAFSVVALSFEDPVTIFTANRPFLAILWDNELSMPLFMAKIEDPVQ